MGTSIGSIFNIPAGMSRQADGSLVPTNSLNGVGVPQSSVYHTYGNADPNVVNQRMKDAANAGYGTVGMGYLLGTGNQTVADQGNSFYNNGTGIRDSNGTIRDPNQSTNWNVSQHGWGNGTDANAAAGWNTQKNNMMGGTPTSVGGGANNQGGVMPNLNTNPGVNNNATNPYGAGYTGFGNSSLSASGNPDYGNGNGSNGSNPSNPGQGNGGYPTGGYYAGQPQSNTMPTGVQGYVPRNTPGLAPAPINTKPVGNPTQPVVTAPTVKPRIPNSFAPVRPPS